MESLVKEQVGEVPAHIIERDGKVLIEKTCPLHGTFTDTLAINTDLPEPGSRPCFRDATFRPSPTNSTITARRPSSTGADRCSPSI